MSDKPAIKLSLVELIEVYRKAKEELVAAAKDLYPRQLPVKVDCAQYKGRGIVVYCDGHQPDQVAVLIPNGNTWYYPMEAVEPVGIELGEE